jgi:hypothetical protein
VKRLLVPATIRAFTTITVVGIVATPAKADRIASTAAVTALIDDPVLTVLEKAHTHYY